MATLDQVIERLGEHENIICGKFDELGQKVEEVNLKVVGHIAAEDAREDLQQKLLVDMQHTLWGNGKPGLEKLQNDLDKRTDRLEQWQNRIGWVMTAIIVPLTLYAAYILMERAFGISAKIP